MSERHRRAAVLAYLLTNHTSPLHLALRLQGIDAAWDLLCDGHPSIPDTLRRRWEALAADPGFLPPPGGAIDLLIPGDALWPPQLQVLGGAEPWALWVTGARRQLLLEQRTVAVVGARAATAYGERVAAELAADVAAAGVTVVSGGALGIDAAAHRGALAVDGPTLAVLASGVDVPYPPTNAALLGAIAREGCIISEVPPGRRPTRQGFLIRNRLIAALAHGTVVVEARARSGSLSTARHALACQRLLMGVPGPVTSPESEGVHELLKAGALLVTSGADVLSLVLPLGMVDAPRPEHPRTEWDDLGEREQLVHEHLPVRGGVDLQQLLAATALDVPGLLAALGTLADRGLVEERVDGTWHRRRTPRGAAA